VEKSSQISSEKFFVLISEKKDITIEELAKSTNLTTRAVKKNISKLKQQGKLRRVRSDVYGDNRMKHSCRICRTKKDKDVIARCIIPHMSLRGA